MNKTFEYEVVHPRWECYEVLEYEIHVDFKKLYGNDFGVLNDMVPTSVMLAEGSEVSVENKKSI